MSSTSLFSGGYIPQGIYVADSQKFQIIVAGLKPNTYHNFFLGDDDNTAKCKQIRTAPETNNTSGLLSDNNGSITFDFYYDAGITEATTDVQQQYKLLTAAASTKIFKIRNTDASSYASGEIQVKFYTALTPEQINSYGTLNVTPPPSNVNNDYNYSYNLANVIDTNASMVRVNENSFSRNWSGRLFDGNALE
jgi:hypothetical protein